MQKKNILFMGSTFGEVKNHSCSLVQWMTTKDAARRATFPDLEPEFVVRTEGAAAQGHKIGACHASPRPPSLKKEAAIDA